MSVGNSHANLRLVTALNDVQVRQLHELFQNEWWTAGRGLDDVRRMLDHSDYVFGFCDSGTMALAAFARVLTDRVFKAFIFDAIVAPQLRDQGLGRCLMEAILEHPDLRSVRHFELYCLPELVPFYARWGFSSNLGGVTLLRRQGFDAQAPDNVLSKAR